VLCLWKMAHCMLMATEAPAGDIDENSFMWWLGATPTRCWSERALPIGRGGIVIVHCRHENPFYL